MSSRRPATPPTEMPDHEADSRNETSQQQLWVAAVAAFCVYFCMYAFRKPFTAATYDGMEIYGLGLKSVLVVSQLLGYMLAKFIGIKIVSEMSRGRRAIAIVVLIAIAEVALIGFAVLPEPAKVLMMFLNGLPLGLVFGLVLSYLEGRKQTEALSAALCASFIVSSGAVKTVGRYLIETWQLSEFVMPMATGVLFLPPLLISVYFLQRTPPPNHEDESMRTERRPLSGRERRDFFLSYWPGLCLLLLIYIVLTIIRTARDDFAVEIWRDMGISETPAVFVYSETVVAVLVTLLNAAAILIPNNFVAIRTTFVFMGGAFVLSAVSGVGQAAGILPPFVFMVVCGVGLYLPYVAYHTTIFERLIAATRRPANLGFLMYLADSLGYLGYAAVMIVRATWQTDTLVLPAFRSVLLVGSLISLASILIAHVYFRTVLAPAGGKVDTMPTASD